MVRLGGGEGKQKTGFSAQEKNCSICFQPGASVRRGDQSSKVGKEVINEDLY